MNNAFIKLHIAIFLAGFTGILGKLIQLAEGPLVWYRLLFTWLLFHLYLALSRNLPRIGWKEIGNIGLTGVILAVHWILFYGSIKYSNVSIAVVCFALVGFFTAIMEPLAGKSWPSIVELLLSLITVAGVALIFHFDSHFRTGIILGVLCAASAALYSIRVKSQGKKYSSSTMLLYQMAGGFVFLCLAAPAYLKAFPDLSLIPSTKDLVYLLVLSSVCTIGLFILEMHALKTLSAFTVNLSFNLEPVYSIVLAMILFNEASELNAGFFIGLGLICLSVLGQSVYAIRRQASFR